MAAAQRQESKLSLDIRTKSIEQTLVPLVTQITTLVNHREKQIKSEKTLRALARVGQAVNLAVERFVNVGEKIAIENADIHKDMCEACREARIAGATIQRLTDVNQTSAEAMSSLGEKTAMVRAARQLLSAITKVLLLADRIVIKQLLKAKDKVVFSMQKIEKVNNFTEFVKSFSTFGTDMVELAHITGDRQNDMKNEKHRAQVGAARGVLEKSTMMLLTTSKALLRHPDCPSARANRDHVISQMRRALDSIHHVVTDGINLDDDNSPASSTANGDSGISLAQHQITASRAIKEFEDLVEMSRVTLISPSTEVKLRSSMETMLETTQDFTDSAYTTHENRERILLLSERVRQELAILLRVGLAFQRDQLPGAPSPQELEMAIIKTRDSSKALRKQLQDTAMDAASEVFKSNEDADLLKAFKTAGLAGENVRVKELAVKFEEHSDQQQEVCKLLRHISLSETLEVWSEHAENVVKTMAPEIINASITLSLHPSSKIAKENLEVFSDTWTSQINDLSVLVKDVNDLCMGKNSERQVYLSLPRPGKHGTTTKNMKPVKLNAEEQAKIAKLGLEMKLISSEMEAETEKWSNHEPENEIVQRAKNMSGMSFSMYLFTRGEGALKTTQDLFTQAEFFAEEGTKLFKAVKDFSQSVPAGPHKNDLLVHLERLPVLCQQLNYTLKSPTVGKAATFNKVDSVIQDTKALMNGIAKQITSCFVCVIKYNIDYRGSPSSSISSSLHAAQQRWRALEGGNGSDGGGSDRESVKSSKSSRSDKMSVIRSSSLNRGSSYSGNGNYC